MRSAGIANPHFVGVRALLFLFFGLSFGALDSRIDCLRILAPPGRFWGFEAKVAKPTSGTKWPRARKSEIYGFSSILSG